MGECCYAIKQIPDLTLGQYDYLSHNGVGGVLQLHRVLLRQLHEKSFLSKVTMHLMYYYRHNGAPGSKIAMIINILFLHDIIVKCLHLIKNFTICFSFATSFQNNKQLLTCISCYF